MFPGSNKLKQSVELRAIPNLTGKKLQDKINQISIFYSTEPIIQAKYKIEMIQEHHDIHVDEQPSG